MLKKLLLMILFLILVILSCANNNSKGFIGHNYTFIGQSGKWSAEFNVLATERFTEEYNKLNYSCESKETFTLVYNGKVSELSDIKNLVYSYEGIAGAGKATLYFDTPPTQTVFRSRTSSRGGAFERQSSVIQVNVEADGVRTEFQLKWTSPFELNGMP